jgi:hypothetical protein
MTMTHSTQPLLLTTGPKYKEVVFMSKYVVYLSFQPLYKKLFLQPPFH